MTRTATPSDFYEILNLPLPTPNKSIPYTKQQLKIAYHKALLKHHPDKAPSASTILDTSTTPLPSHTNSSSQSYTIDEITTAYRTLSDPSLRAEYDRALRLDRDRAARAGGGKGTVFHTGLEVVDLEDLDCEEDTGSDGGAVWYRGCRCGDERGFMVSEEDLEREVENGEVVIGCRGCSLYMKVLFAVQDDDDEDLDAGKKT
ncbi:CSL zinc finger-domain-containing protein [Aspergillus karnatakaensis]|uniref:diphthamide biosynthesis protein 4 n=1 Tax=Aspergillus karnatakaensis TaxID=1810916 RepID=UPI003CCE1185